MDSLEIRKRLTGKIERKEKLTDKELMEFVILPLTYKGKEKKREIIEELFSIAKQQAMKQLAEEVTKEVTEEVTKEVTKEVAQENARALLREGDSVEKVARCVKQLSMKGIQKLAEKLQREKHEG
ncbi:MAG: hypothetical protein EOM18_13530 [Clostridia bacterium]|nr:hypothetical protein [Clostridia bacterium]